MPTSLVSETQDRRLDVVVFGGSIAGLWLFSLLRQRGYRAVLLTRGLLGRGQTLWSQCMIHGGVKYLLNGKLTNLSETIADMPARWRAHFDGCDEPNLSGVPLQSEAYYMFSNADRFSRLLSFLGSRALRGRVVRLKRGEFPAVFADRRFRGKVYRLHDIVVDMPALLARLASVAPQDLYDIGTDAIGLRPADDGWELRIGSVRCRARRCLFAAGDGNEELMRLAGIEDIPMQRRAMQQIFMRSPQLPELYAHYIDGVFRYSPLLTISTHSDGAGGCYWSIGGDVATSGAERTGAEQIEQTRSYLTELLPWLVPADAHWETANLSVAEPEAGGLLPNEPFVQMRGRVIVAWPSKLTLVPVMADRVLAMLADLAPTAGEIPRLPLSQTRVAVSPWEANADG